MDILKPRLMWVNDRCYRVFGDISDYVPEDDDLRGYGDTADTFRSESPLGVDVCEDDESDEEYDIREKENGLLEHSFHVPKALHSILIGSKGSTRARLEKESKVRLSIPMRGKDGDVVLSAQKRGNIIQARRRINLMILSARQRQPFTHFLSIPMTFFKDQFEMFKKRVLEENQSRTVKEEIFQDPDKLHLTLGTLTLFDDYDRKKAAEALTHCRKEVINPLMENRTLLVRMHGIEYMNDDPAEVDVLYGCVQDLSDEGIVQELADKVVQYFVKTGLMPKQHEKVKLHVTLLNSIFAQSSTEQDDTARTGEGRKRQSFDATAILANFSSFDFGDAVLERIDISQRYTTAADGYYCYTATVSLYDMSMSMWPRVSTVGFCMSVSTGALLLSGLAMTDSMLSLLLIQMQEETMPLTALRCLIMYAGSAAYLIGMADHNTNFLEIGICAMTISGVASTINEAVTMTDVWDLGETVLGFAFKVYFFSVILSYYCSECKTC